MNEKQASPLGRALEFVDANQFDDAVTFLRQEIGNAYLDRSDTADLLGLLGGVLSKLGRMDEATVAFREAVGEASASAPNGRPLQVSIARYMLADHLLSSGDATGALAEASGALRDDDEGGAHAMLHAVSAEALRKLGRDADARVAAAAALAGATSEQGRESMRKRLAGLLADPAAAD